MIETVKIMRWEKKYDRDNKWRDRIKKEMLDDEDVIKKDGRERYDRGRDDWERSDRERDHRK